jgi:hypothetical protein
VRGKFNFGDASICTGDVSDLAVWVFLAVKVDSNRGVAVNLAVDLAEWDGAEC